MYSVNVILLKMVKVELIMSFSPVILCPSYIFVNFLKDWKGLLYVQVQQNSMKNILKSQL